MAARLPLRIILSGGGTGGHVYPAIAIADALKELPYEVEILFVGANGKVEMKGFRRRVILLWVFLYAESSLVFPWPICFFPFGF